MIVGEKLKELVKDWTKTSWVENIVENKKIVEAVTVPIEDEQIQVNGIDLTATHIYKIASDTAYGVIPRKGKATIPEYNEVKSGRLTISSPKTDTYIAMASSRKWLIDAWNLSPGVYVVEFGENIKIPKNTTVVGKTRSSLIRSGATIHSAVWDSGYEGVSRSLLVVHTGLVIERGARVLQLMFYENNEETEYTGTYKDEESAAVEETVKMFDQEGE